MICRSVRVVLTAWFLPALLASLTAAADEPSPARAWEGTLDVPTYPWGEDINPKFWALEGGARLSTTVRGSIVYPYVMQDDLSRQKTDRTYKALFLENEYLRVTCLPELGGRLHSVLDKTTGEEMFHRSGVIKPGMIAMRGAWISGGVEWNSGPHGHTVTIVSPVDAAIGEDPDGSVWLQIANQEQIFRTRWTVRVTLHPGRAYLDERIRIENPTDGMHPYYFWNCTAFPNRPGTRFIYPMTLGTDHNAREFFRWPVHEGRDLSWLKNYETYASVFAVDCFYGFFGAYDAGADRGIVQVANPHELVGKKAWTWGEWEFGKVAQQNLTDEDGPYIEVQSGPLPTQSDYGMLGPHERIAWQEYWYPVSGLGDGFEFATRDVAFQTARRDGRLELRVASTARFPGAQCVVDDEGRELLRQRLELAPGSPAVVRLEAEPNQAVQVTLLDGAERVLAKFTTPLPIPLVEPPDPARFRDRPDEQRTAEELYLEGRRFDRATERLRAREYYQRALQRDPGHVDSLRAVAVLDFEAGLYRQAIAGAEKALQRDSDDGWCWFYCGASRLRLGEYSKALRCGYRAARCSSTASLGYDLAGRASMRLGDLAGATAEFAKAVAADPQNTRAREHHLLALQAGGKLGAARSPRRSADPLAILPAAVRVLDDDQRLAEFARGIREVLGEPEFELLEASLVIAELGLWDQAARLVRVACVEAAPPDEQGFLPLYYLAWYTAQAGDAQGSRPWLERAAATTRPRVFASRPEEVEILQSAVRENSGDAQAQLQLGCLLAHLGRVEEALPLWHKAAELDPQLNIAWRNLGLAAAARDDLRQAESFYRRAIAARPDDQTLYRDLAEILLAADRRPDAIEVLETMPVPGMRRAEITVMLAQAYLDQQQYEKCIQLLTSTPYFVNWEGQDITWRLFNRAHLARGQQRLESGAPEAALVDFETALTYPANLNVGRSNKPVEAPAQYWRGRALAALGRDGEARAAWQLGVDGANVPGMQNEYRQKCRQLLAGDESQ